MTITSTPHGYARGGDWPYRRRLAAGAARSGLGGAAAVRPGARPSGAAARLHAVRGGRGPWCRPWWRWRPPVAGRCRRGAGRGRSRGVRAAAGAARHGPGTARPAYASTVMTINMFVGRRRPGRDRRVGPRARRGRPGRAGVLPAGAGPGSARPGWTRCSPTPRSADEVRHDRIRPLLALPDHDVRARERGGGGNMQVYATVQPPRRRAAAASNRSTRSHRTRSPLADYGAATWTPSRPPDRTSRPGSCSATSTRPSTTRRTRADLARLPGRGRRGRQGPARRPGGPTTAGRSRRSPSTTCWSTSASAYATSRSTASPAATTGR